MIDRSIIDAVRSSIRLNEIVQETVGLKRKSDDDWIGLCPFHNERTPSFHVHPETGFFKCFGCGAGGDVIDFVRRHNGVTFEAAVELLTSRTGDVLTKTVQAKPRIPTRQPSQTWLRLQEQLKTPTIAELQQIATLRKLPTIAGLELAVRAKTLFTAEVFDYGFHEPCWIITDSSRRNAQARRLDGQPFAGIGGKKAKTIQGCEASWPIGIQDCTTPEIALVEGGPDFLAAHHLTWFLGRSKTTTPVAMLGASNQIHAQALPLFSAKTVWIFPHTDDNQAGEKAAARWSEQLRSVNAAPIPSPLQSKDLNDFIAECDHEEECV